MSRSTHSRARLFGFRACGPVLVLAVLSAGPAAAGGAPFCELEVERATAGPSAVAEALVFPFGITSAVPSLSVTTLAGEPVAHKIVWQSPDDPWLIRFDATAGDRWRIRFEDGTRASTATSRVAGAGVFLETRALPEGIV